MTLELQNITKRWGAVVAADSVSLAIRPGELVSLVGPSGSGKTTLLQIMAGLVEPDSGRVLFSGRDVSHVGVRKRGVGFVFQQYALFRHMSVFENVAFGLRVLPFLQRPNESAIRARVQELLGLVQLEELATRRPAQLSGGQRQRVALARALAVKPEVLLLDEPFAALDPKVRDELRRWLRRLHDQLHVTSVLVTHDQSEALEISDRVVVMNQGRLEQVGPPAELLDQPATAFVHEFVGEVNAFQGFVENGQVRIGPLRVPLVARGDFPELAPVRVLVRQYDVSVTLSEAAHGEGTVERLSVLGDRLKVSVLLDGVGNRRGPSLVAQLHRDPLTGTPLERGARVRVKLDRPRIYGMGE